MLNVDIEINEREVKKMCLKKLDDEIKKIDTELLFWDSRELERRTCMSWGTIQKEFFFHPDFPKRKVGGKWYFPAQETKDFLLNWLDKRGI